MSDTRQLLIENSCEVFAEKGYLASTVAEICKKANANVAAINYHFGSKENLYREAVAFAFKTSEAQYPLLNGGITPKSSPTKRLNAYIKAYLSRIFSEGMVGYYYKMLSHELSNPESPMNHFFREWNHPDRSQLREIIQAIARKELPEKQMHTCLLNIWSSCLFFGFNQNIRKLIMSSQTFSQEEVDDLADDITQFALGGIRAVARTIPSK